MQGGRAIAEVALGLVEPSGRLPISFARHAGQQPTYYNQIRGQHGDRYADLTQDPAYAFGEGLSYTRVEYSDETVQAYVSDRVTSVSWAEKELKAFPQVSIAPGESVRATIDVSVADCSLVDARGSRVVEAGEFSLLVGPSSRAEVRWRRGSGSPTDGSHAEKEIVS